MRVYFDYNATTPLAPEVIEAVARATRELFGNASSVHHFGQQAKAAIDEARSAVATLINARSVRDRVHERRHRVRQLRDPRRRRSARADRPPPSGRQRDRARSRAEHAARRSRGAAGARRSLPVDQTGIVVARPRCARRSPSDTALVSVMHANNEIGTIQPIAELAAHRARARRADAHRRRAVGRQDSGRRARARRRPALALGAQVQRTERRRRALDQARHAACSRF